MVDAANIVVKEVSLFERDVRLRMPFRFGAATMRGAPQLFAVIDVEGQNNRRATGYAAEILAPKWFDKNPSLSNEQNFEQLRQAALKARASYLRCGFSSPFGLFAENYAELSDVAPDQQLVAAFGQALLDRAVIDAVCRLEGVSFFAAIQRNRAGIAPHSVAPDLAGEGDGAAEAAMGAFLRGLAPSATIAVRHTVGLLDPLEENPEPVGDGLPETLRDVVETYGNRYFKLKLSGDRDADVDRLARIIRILEPLRPDYRLSLDGNEQYADAEPLVDFLEMLSARAGFETFLKRVLFIEQPIARSRALATDVSALARFAPVVIDESDGALSAFPEALALGYRGVSSKSCKGFYKSLINLYRCRRRGAGCFMTGEDLTMQAGLAVQQDLALVSLLGLGHVERNGHHFANGMAAASDAEQQRFLDAHPDLYTRSHGAVRLAIRDGSLAISSLDCPGFASRVLPDVSTMRPVSLIEEL